MISFMARKHYTDEFRRQAVDLYESTEDATLSGIAAELSIARGTLADWSPLSAPGPRQPRRAPRRRPRRLLVARPQPARTAAGPSLRRPSSPGSRPVSGNWRPRPASSTPSGRS